MEEFFLDNPRLPSSHFSFFVPSLLPFFLLLFPSFSPSCSSRHRFLHHAPPASRRGQPRQASACEYLDSILFPSFLLFALF